MKGKAQLFSTVKIGQSGSAGTRCEKTFSSYVNLE